MSLTITPADRDAIYVFATDPASVDVAVLAEPGPLNGKASETVGTALGLPDLTPDAVEVVNPADLAGLGLASYLTEGLGLSEESVSKDRARLNALTTPVVLLQASAVGLDTVMIDLPRSLQYIGRYPAAKARTTMEPQISDSARGTLPPDAPAGPAAEAPRRRGWGAALLLGGGFVLILLALLYAWLG